MNALTRHVGVEIILKVMVTVSAYRVCEDYDLCDQPEDKVRGLKLDVLNLDEKPEPRVLSEGTDFVDCCNHDALDSDQFCG